MKVLVTGGAGYIGSHTVAKLIENGFTPVVFDNLSTGFKEAVPSTVPFVQGDIRNLSEVVSAIRTHGVQAVIHFAAKLVVPESVEKPLEYYENNVFGTLKLLEACAACGVEKLIFSSTAAVYGNPAKVPVNEEATPAPMSPYGASKLMSERMIDDYAKSGRLKYVVLRYFNVAGGAISGMNGQRTKNATHLVKVASEVAAGKRSHLEIFGTDYATPDGTGIRDYIHVDDLAAAHVDALKYLAKENSSSQIFNVGYGRGYSVREVISAMASVAAVNLATREVSRRAGDPAVIVADSSKIQNVLHWKARYDDLEMICKTALNWEKAR